MTPITLRTLQVGGVVLCLIAVAVTTVVIPSLAPPTFLAASITMLVIAMWIHRSEFAAEEYNTNGLIYKLRSAASGITILIAIAGIVGFWYFSQHNSSFAGPSPLPIALPKIGGGLTSVAKNAVSRIKEVMRTGTIDM